MKIYILSGGKSSRMCEDKGLKALLGKPMISYLLDTLAFLDAEIIIVTNNKEYRKLGIPFISDFIKEKGPIGGIFTALMNAGEDVLILSADTPFISLENIIFLIEKHQKNRITLVSSGEKYYPLFAIYPFGLVGAVKNNIENGNLKLFKFLEENGFQEVELELSPLEKININTIQDLEIAEKYLKNGN